MEREFLALVQETKQKAILINWQFSLQKARTTFQKHYLAINRNTNILR
jgi:hypothetical protein